MGLEPEKWATRIGLDPENGTTPVAVTDRRIITAKPNALRQQGEISHHIPIDQVRYVRPATTQDQSGRAKIDLITRDKNIQWLFHADTDNTHVDALAAVLAESMTIPDGERDELQRRGHALVEAGETGEISGMRPAEPTGLEATVSDAE